MSSVLDAMKINLPQHSTTHSNTVFKISHITAYRNSISIEYLENKNGKRKRR